MLKPIAFIKDERGDGGQCKRDAEDNEERGRVTVGERQHYVHAEEARHRARQADDDRERGEGFHHAVEVVRDDRSERVHHARKNFCGDGGHLNGLLVFGEHVFEQVLIVFVIIEDLRALHALHHHFVGTERGGEIGEALLLFEQFKHLAVARGFLQLVFNCLGHTIDLAQMREITGSGF